MPARTAPFEKVADGVYLLARANVNCYLVVSDRAITLVDGGLPGTWPVLKAALASIGATTDDIDAIVLTHGHFDHVGMCDRLSHEHHRPIHVHESDREMVRHPYRYPHERPRWQYPFRYPRSIPILAGMVASGAIGIKGIQASGDVRSGVALPGGLIPVPSPGHTPGHYGFFLEKQGVLFAGDAVVTLDPYTGETGPRIVAGAATADRATALEGLDAYVATGAQLVLTGHGAPFDGGIGQAVRLARAAGVR
ncbi:MBL fold metallo-hydrolase [Microbacterium sp. P04]|uniref:MBL fold metallo-hydrolase n=1 Tax=Microbacterium sp. P04 TaxID=3366947 RepID=UPI003747227A